MASAPELSFEYLFECMYTSTDFEMFKKASKVAPELFRNFVKVIYKEKKVEFYNFSDNSFLSELPVNYPLHVKDQISHPFHKEIVLSFLGVSLLIHKFSFCKKYCKVIYKTNGITLPDGSENFISDPVISRYSKFFFIEVPLLIRYNKLEKEILTNLVC